MNTVLKACQNQRRIDRERQNRSDAMNRTLTEANGAIDELKAELLATRVAAGIAVISLIMVLIRNALECVL